MLVQNVVLVFHVIIAVSLVALVLLQQGKGADAGAAFGAGASGTVFGSKGSSSFLTRTTGILATLFFITSLTLFVLATQAKTARSVVDQVKSEQKVETKSVKPVTSPVSDVPAADDKAVEIKAKPATKSSTPDVPAAD